MRDSRTESPSSRAAPAESEPASVRLFAAEGAHVLIADIQEDLGKQLARVSARPPVPARRRHARREVKGAVDEAVSRWGRLDVMFNKRRVRRRARADRRHDGRRVRLTFDGLVRARSSDQAHGAVMKRQRSGSIIKHGVGGRLQTGHSPHLYSVAKAAVIHLTRSVALELGESGIRVTASAPASSRRRWPRAHRRHARAAREAEEHPRAHPGARRSADPEDIARAALGSPSDRVDFVTGHAQVVDGGAFRRSAVEQAGGLDHDAAGDSMYPPARA